MRASSEEFSLDMLSVIYRLLEVEGETDFAGPLMIDSLGIIRVADYLDPSQPASYSFFVEELSPDGTSSQSDIQTLTITDICAIKHVLHLNKK